MRILAVEFSSARRSVAVGEGDGRGPAVVRGVASEQMPGEQGALGLVAEALAAAGWEREQVECVAVGLGPGSYTGIRAAISLAQGWQLAREVTLLGVSSVEALVAAAHAEGLRGPIQIAIDAHRNEFYLAGYALAECEWREVEPLRLVPVAELSARLAAGEIVLGPDLDRWLPGARVRWPEAGWLARLAAGRSDFVAGEKLEPIYLRQTSFVKAPPPRLIP